MNGQELFDWLASIPADQRADCTVWLKTEWLDNKPLITAKVYDNDRDGKLDTIYLIYK